MTHSSEKKLEELYQLIDQIEIALLTTQRADGSLASRPMATQERGPDSDIWFVTDIETHKVEDLKLNPQVGVSYYNSNTMEWVSVSGIGSISQDRKKIEELYKPDWKVWFEDEGGNRDGGPDDPRLALIFVDAQAVTYMKNKHSKPRVMFEIARGYVTGESPDIGEQHHLSPLELGGRYSS